MRRVLPLVVALAGCRNEPNPAYCDDSRPCGPGYTCGADNTCAGGADDGGVDGGCAVACGGGTPYCVAGECVACLESGHCPGDTPVCGVAGACEPCSADDQCAARPDGSAAGLCTPGGACVLDDDVVLVDGEAACTALAPPFCQIGDAVTWAASMGKPDVVVMETSAGYGPFEVNGATVRIFGKARPAGVPTVTGLFGADAIHVIGES